MRDEIIKVAGVPFKRLLVYRLEVKLPLATTGGLALFAITKGFTIGSITTSASHPFVNDAKYLLQDISDGETIGIVAVIGGEDGLLPMAIPDLPAGLGGPCRVMIQYLSGVQNTEGSLIFQISVNGPPSTEDGITVDLNQDGVPDELAEEILPLPGFVLMESFDDFYAGFNAGASGVDTQ
jgi:hypothetical protein